MTDTFDVAIIGAGPAGLAAAIYCGRYRLSTIMFGNIFDSQIAKAGRVENYPGIESIQGIELIEKFDHQAQQYGITVVPVNVTRIIPGEAFTIYADVDKYMASSIIMATGSKHRELNIPGEKALAYKGVSYCSICDGSLYKDRPVAMVGSGDLAAKAALYLAGLCKVVYVITDKPDMDSPMYNDQVRATGNVRMVANARVTSISGKEFVENVQYVADGEAGQVDVEAVFIEGGIPNSLLAQELGLDLDGKGNVVVKRPELATNVPGVFAAGDVIEGIHQVSRAVGDGASAAMSAIYYVKRLKRGGGKSPQS